MFPTCLELYMKLFAFLGTLCQKIMFISVISDINQVVHTNISHQIDTFTVFLVNLRGCWKIFKYFLIIFLLCWNESGYIMKCIIITALFAVSFVHRTPLTIGGASYSWGQWLHFHRNMEGQPSKWDSWLEGGAISSNYHLLCIHTVITNFRNFNLLW